jgi:hypothetical protein
MEWESKIISLWPGVMVHTCNSSYLGGGDWADHCQGQPGQKCTTLSEK